jgi:inhibitor of KinA sporulation pathway (predicted exonuclease)
MTKAKFLAFERVRKSGLEGTHHRGVDDAENITKIFKAIYPDLPGLG